MARLVVAALCLCFSPYSAAQPCPLGWQQWQQSCYRLTSSGLTWQNALSACQGMGGEMAAPQSHEENQFMVQMAPVDQNGQFALWIGCSDIDLDKVWVCEGQGESEPFLNFREGQPTMNRKEYFAGVSDMDGGWYYWKGDLADRSAVCVIRREPCVRVHRPVQAACGYRPGPRRYCFSTDADGQLLNSCLFGHVISEFATKSNPSCAAACIMEPGCRSFNVKHVNQEEKICQLNNATRCDGTGEFEVDFGSFCVYSQECID